MRNPIPETIAAAARQAAADSSKLLHSLASKSAKTYRNAAMGVRGTDELAQVDRKPEKLLRWVAVGAAASIISTQVAGDGTVVEEAGTAADPGIDPAVGGRIVEVPPDDAGDRITDPLEDPSDDHSGDDIRKAVRELLRESRETAADDTAPGSPSSLPGDENPFLWEDPPPWLLDDMGGYPGTGVDNPRPSADPSEDDRRAPGVPAPPPPDNSGSAPLPRPPSMGVPADDPFDQDGS